MGKCQIAKIIGDNDIYNKEISEEKSSLEEEQKMENTVEEDNQAEE